VFAAIQNCHPGGAGGQFAGGAQPGGGVHPGGASGHPGAGRHDQEESCISEDYSRLLTIQNKCALSVCGAFCTRDGSQTQYSEEHEPKSK